MWPRRPRIAEQSRLVPPSDNAYDISDSVDCDRYLRSHAFQKRSGFAEKHYGNLKLPPRQRKMPSRTISEKFSTPLASRGTCEAYSRWGVPIWNHHSSSAGSSWLRCFNPVRAVHWCRIKVNSQRHRPKSDCLGHRFGLDSLHADVVPIARGLVGLVQAWAAKNACVKNFNKG